MIKQRFLLTLVGALLAISAAHAADKPNIVIIWGDDIGQSNVSAYTRGLMGYRDAQHRQHRQRRDDVHRLLR